MYLATTESPLSVTMGGGEALIWPSAVLGGEGVPELDGQDSSNSSGELGPVARALEASGSLDLWDVDGLRVPISHHVFLPSSLHSLLTGWHTALSVGCPHLGVPGLASEWPVVASNHTTVPTESWQIPLSCSPEAESDAQN